MNSATIAPVTHFVSVAIVKKTSALDDGSADTNRHDVTVRYADTEGGAAIDSTLNQPADETSTLGTYEATFLDTDLVTFLLAREGRDIYRDVYLGTVLYESTALKVVRAP